jgi:hypothetical protein
MKPSCPGLAGAVVRPAGIAGVGSGDGGGEDDPPAPGLGQLGQAGFHREEGAAQVDPHDLVELRDRHFADFGGGEDASIGAENVDAAEMMQRGGSHRGDALLGADIGGDGDRRTPGDGDVLGDDLRRLGRAGHHGDATAGLGEAFGDAPADALAGAGDDDAAALE